METQPFSFAASPFVPVAIGFFGLGTGYFIWGWAVPVWFSENEPRSEQNDGNVGVLDAGFHAVPHWCLSSGWTDLVQRFRKCSSFVYGWSRLHGLRNSLVRNGLRRYIDSSAQPDGWMAIAFLFLSVLGVDVFRRAGDIPVMLIFVGLTLIYAIEIPTRLLSWNFGVRLVGLFQFITGTWLMYCTYATTVDLALGAKAWV